MEIISMGAAWLVLILESLPSCPMILPSLSIKNENVYQQKESELYFPSFLL